MSLFVSDLVVFLRHCMLYKFTYLKLTYFAKNSNWAKLKVGQISLMTVCAAWHIV